MLYLLDAAKSLFSKQNCSFLELYERPSLEYDFLEKCYTEEAFSFAVFLLMGLNQLQCGFFFSSLTKSQTEQKRQVYWFSSSVNSSIQRYLILSRKSLKDCHKKKRSKKVGTELLVFFVVSKPLPENPFQRWMAGETVCISKGKMTVHQTSYNTLMVRNKQFELFLCLNEVNTIFLSDCSHPSHSCSC